MGKTSVFNLIGKDKEKGGGREDGEGVGVERREQAWHDLLTQSQPTLEGGVKQTKSFVFGCFVQMHCGLIKICEKDSLLYSSVSTHTEKEGEGNKKHAEPEDQNPSTISEGIL